MSGRVFITLAVVATLAGCAQVAESRFNPLNWFGRSTQVETAVAGPGQPGDARNLVAQITTLRIEQVPGGAIIRATGLPATQGYFDGELVPIGREVADNGVLSYQFRISPPFAQTRVSTTQSREVVVGLFVSTQTLTGVREIRVNGAQNALSVRR